MNLTKVVSLFCLSILIVSPSHLLASNTNTAYFAGGCFWCTESSFEKLKGVLKVISGYMGGKKEKATYKLVSAGQTKHREVIKVIYDPNLISYAQLLNRFWTLIDPEDSSGSFVDRGFQYSSAIYTVNSQQHKLAQLSKKYLVEKKWFKNGVATEVLNKVPFYVAEEYHQDFYKKSPERYQRYRKHSGRDQFYESFWKQNPLIFNEPKTLNKKERIKSLTPIQFKVTQKDGTERPFNNEYWNNKKDGIYVDIVLGEVLFSSKDKYKSGTGWPSFIRPIKKSTIVENTDYKLNYPRTEVRSKYSNSHLGHVFNDGPKPTGLRYCINSAALKFIPVDQMLLSGYGHYLHLFD